MSAVWNQYQHTFSGLTHLAEAAEAGSSSASGTAASERDNLSPVTTEKGRKKEREKEKHLLCFGICFFSSSSSARESEWEKVYIKQTSFCDEGSVFRATLSWHVGLFSADGEVEIAKASYTSPQIRRSLMLLFFVLTFVFRFAARWFVGVLLFLFWVWISWIDFDLPWWLSLCLGSLIYTKTKNIWR